MIRDHINIVEAESFGSNRTRLPFRDQIQETRDSLDRLLGCQDCSKMDKAKALREIGTTATRMADQIERHLRDQERRDQEI